VRGEIPALTPDPNPSSALEFILQVEDLYAALVRPESAIANGEPSLGGKLLYTGELSAYGRALLVAGNIAGAASLAATADVTAQKQAIRDGVADFLVTSLDEALRILKNEIRKRETVAVCIAASPDAVEREMLERGVVPDLLPSLGSPVSPTTIFGQGARRIELSDDESGRDLVAWSVAAAPSHWLPRLDALALDCFCRDSTPEALAARRWLRLAPRYLGRIAQGLRLLRCQPDATKEFVSRAQSAVDRGEFGVEVRISVNKDTEVFLFQPSEATNAEGEG